MGKRKDGGLNPPGGNRVEASLEKVLVRTIGNFAALDLDKIRVMDDVEWARLHLLHGASARIYGALREK